MKNRARIFKCLWGPGMDSKESIPPVYVAWRAGTITLFLLGSSLWTFKKFQLWLHILQKLPNGLFTVFIDSLFLYIFLAG